MAAAAGTEQPDDAEAGSDAGAPFYPNQLAFKDDSNPLRFMNKKSNMYDLQQQARNAMAVCKKLIAVFNAKSEGQNVNLESRVSLIWGHLRRSEGQVVAEVDKGKSKGQRDAGLQVAAPARRNAAATCCQRRIAVST